MWRVALSTVNLLACLPFWLYFYLSCSTFSRIHPVLLSIWYQWRTKGMQPWLGCHGLRHPPETLLRHLPLLHLREYLPQLPCLLQLRHLRLQFLQAVHLQRDRQNHIRPQILTQFLFHSLTTYIPLLNAIPVTSNVLFTRFTSKSIRTPTTSATYTLKKFPPQALQGAEIRNISSMDCRATGTGHAKLRIIGVTFLNFLSYMAPTLIIMWPLRIRRPRHQHQRYLHWQT